MITWDEKNRERPEEFIDYDEPWLALSCAIIKQCCDDWKKGGKRTRSEITKFIQSDYFRKISNIDPDYLLKQLNEAYPTARPNVGFIRG